MLAQELGLEPGLGQERASFLHLAYLSFRPPVLVSSVPTSCLFVNVQWALDVFINQEHATRVHPIAVYELHHASHALCSSVHQTARCAVHQAMSVPLLSKHVVHAHGHIVPVASVEHCKHDTTAHFALL